jgi:hypothetical protein
MPRVARGDGQSVLERRGGNQQIRPSMPVGSGQPAPAAGDGNLDGQDSRRSSV